MKKINKNICYKIARIIPDELYLKIIYRIKLKKKLNLKKPRTFNEKLQWLKLYDRKEIYTTMVDKYEVKKYVADIIGKEYIIPTLEVYKTFDEIDFQNLPEKFVIKCTHDSGGLVICRNKNNFDSINAKKIIEKSLNNNYYYLGREWPYKNVQPRIIIEEYMEDEETKELRDYKFFCFNGIVKYFKIDFNREINHRANYYDRKGNLQYFGECICPPEYNKKIDKPKNLAKMIKLSETLSKNHMFLRVDFYEVNNKIYFGELTFYPCSGFGKFEPEEYDEILGSMLKLNIEGDKNAKS